MDGEKEMERARRRVGLLAARGEFAEARAERALRGFADEAAQIRLDGSDQALLDRHAFRTRTLLDAERTLQADLHGEVELGEAFEGWATRALISSDMVTELRTSTTCVLVPGDVCRWVMIVAAELVHVAEASADPNRGCRISVTIDHVETGLVMRLSSIGGLVRPVPSRSGASALERTARIMRVLGDFRHGVEGSDLTWVATFAGAIACPAS